MVAPDLSPTASLREERSANEPRTIRLFLGGQIAPADAIRLGRHVRALIESPRADLLVCDVSSLTRPHVATVDAICRMRLIARRHGCRLRLEGVSTELRELVHLTGLTEVLPVTRDASLRPKRQPEQRKHARGVKEERDPADPAA